VSGTTPVPGQFVPVTGLTERANGTEIASVEEIGTILVGWAPPPVVSAVSTISRPDSGSSVSPGSSGIVIRGAASGSLASSMVNSREARLDLAVDQTLQALHLGPFHGQPP
jgi:hypothetical protein